MREQRVSLGLRKPTPVVLQILLLWIGAYIASAVAARFPQGAAAVRELVLFPDQVLHGHVWQLLSYALLHDLERPTHLIFNCLGIYFFAPQLEERWGTRRFLLFAVMAAFVGGLFVVATYLLHIGGNPTLGGSAIALGVTMAWGLTFADSQMWFNFILPMKGRTLVWVTLALWALDAISLSATSAAAHLGGIVVGAVMGAGLLRGNTRKLWWDALLVKLHIRRPPKLTVVPRGPDKWVH